MISPKAALRTDTNEDGVRMSFTYAKPETYQALLALSVGDAAGENQMKLLPAIYNIRNYKAGNVAAMREPSILWPWTDDTHLAIGLTRTLFTFGTVNQVELAKEFARNFRADTQRGYGRGTFGLLKVFQQDAENWEQHSHNWWGPNQGSKGNGSAMRDAIIGAHFGPDLDRIKVEARKSAEVTHFNDEAIAGSIAVAIAASVATYGNMDQFWSTILAHTPAGPVRDRIEWTASPEALAETNWGIVVKVGNGKDVTALDTVPFALWQAFQTITKRLPFSDAVDSIIEVGGDTDTIAAIVGGIIGNTVKPTQDEILRTEPLPSDIVPFVEGIFQDRNGKGVVVSNGEIVAVQG
jgi:ADP-ribosylglycohydrolase